jgi:hypothetical protein
MMKRVAQQIADAPTEVREPRAAAPHPFSDNEPWPEPMNKAAFQGLAGRFVRLIEPHSEADPVGILGQFLGAFSNAGGRSPHFTVEADRHSLNLYQVHVGKSSKARKGTAWGRAKQAIAEADPDWSDHIVHGLSSGEGLIHAVRDPIERRDPIKKKNGRVIDYETVIADHGVEDKRLLVMEAEFASVLKVCDRAGNTLSPILRMGWDSGNLGTLTRNNPLKATGAHISIIGHITTDELLRHLDSTESANGFANRFLWFCVRRSKALPEGGSLAAHELAPVIAETSDALAFAKNVGEIRRDAGATEIWHAVYEELSEGKPGLLGAMIARGEAQVMRLACIYAVLDRSSVIRVEHLRAALAVWEYCERSVRHIFGEKLGDPTADRIVDALRDNPVGLTRTDISSLFGRHISGSQIGRALQHLKSQGHASPDVETTGGRPIERWRITGP